MSCLSPVLILHIIYISVRVQTSTLGVSVWRHNSDVWSVARELYVRIFHEIKRSPDHVILKRIVSL